MTAGLVLVAGGEWGTAVRLGLAMLGIQLSIGAFNDLRDAAADAISKPAKPIPSGTARRGEARLLAIGGLGVGLALSWPSGPIVTAVAAAGAACGYLYDIGLKRTPLSWLPLAIALPLLPAFAWLGASAGPASPLGGGFPPGAVILVPLAIVAGAALAISNALVDLDADHAAGLSTVVARLGQGPSWLLHAGLLAAVVLVALAALIASQAGGPGVVAFGAGVALVVVGGWLTRRPGSVVAGVRGSLARRAWEIETLGIGLLGLGWVAAMAPAGA